MKRASLGAFMVFSMLAILAVTLVKTGPTNSVSAEDYRTKPVMLNELFHWCGDSEYGDVSDCDLASYNVMTDGSIRVLFNDSPGESFNRCTTELTIPVRAQGWAYVIISPEFLGIGTPPPAPTFPLTYTPDGEATWAAASNERGELFGPEQRVVMSFAELRDLIPPSEDRRLNADAFQICEIVVQSTDFGPSVDDYLTETSAN